jgi:hypothetical protein
MMPYCPLHSKNGAENLSHTSNFSFTIIYCHNS